MNQTLTQLNGIPWINVVESVRAYDEYSHTKPMEDGLLAFVNNRYRIIHVTFAVGISRTERGGVDLLEKLRNKIITDYVFDTILGGDRTDMYPWIKLEGAEVTIFDGSAIDLMCQTGVSKEDILNIGKSLDRDDRLWLSVRMPWEITQDYKVSYLMGRFGCAIFHKDAERVEA